MKRQADMESRMNKYDPDKEYWNPYRGASIDGINE